MFGKSAFGSGGGFGQQPQQTSVFGQQPQQQQSAFGGFGATSTPSTAFGSTTNTGTSAFGQPAQTSAFGSTGTTGGFGTGTSAFGQSRPSAFGGTSTFGSAQPSTGFGGFGSTTTSAPSAFGSTTTQTGGGLFGQSRPSAFGTATTSTPSAFGSTTGTSAFGQSQPQQSAFGMGATTSTFGQPTAAGAGQGTAIADFSPTQDRDIASGVNNFFQTITAMPQYRNYSLEELRLQDYAQNRKTSGAAAAPGGFGTATTGGFGSTATTTPFGQTGGSAFGQQGTSAFGQPQTSSAFGSTGTGTSLFGQQQQPSTGTSAFGPGTTGGFGSTGGGFGSTTGTGGFGSTGTGAFGSAASTAAKPLFGSTQPSTGGFGTSATSAFGQQSAGTSAFGQTNQQQQTGFGFGQKPAGTTTGGFGTGTTGGFGTGFGSTATSKPTTSFSFGATGGQQTGTTGFGGGFGSTGTGTTGFGQTQTSQPGSLFGANKPAGTGTSLFGNTTQQTTGTGFGFGTGQTGTGFGGTGGTSLFGAKPAAGTGTTGNLFGNTQTGTTGFGGFGAQQGGSTFTIPATGGLTSFGTSSQTQQPLVASVDQNPYGKNPLFEDAKPGATTLGGKTEPSAVPIEGADKKPLAPHYPISPRVVSKIKLRGFSFSPSPKPGSKRMSSLEGISDDAVLGAGAFTLRPSNKKLVFDKDISSKEVTFLANKKENRSKILFDPKLELVTPNKDDGKQQQQQQPTVDEATKAISIGETSAPSAAFSSVSSQNGYYSSPTLDALLTMSKDELKHVEGFVVGRKGYGEVRFQEPVDLSQVNLHEIMGELIVIERRTVVVYPKEERKAPEGSEMNKPAIITINGCFPEDKDTNQAIKDPNHPRVKSYEERLKKKRDTEFISYDAKTGEWKFRVKHF